MSHGLLTVTDATFASLVAGADRPVLLDFWADWCPPCKVLGRILSEIAPEYAGRVLLAGIDADENPETVRAYAVMSMPTVIAFRDGEMVGRFVGSRPKPVLRAFLDELAAPAAEIGYQRSA